MKMPHLHLPKRLADAGVIVASILLAFSLDALWDSLQARQESRELLAAIMAEVEVVAEGEADIAEVNREIVAAADTIVERLRSSQEEVRIPVRTLSYLFRTPTTDPPSGALAVWIASGRATLIQDRRLRDLLTQLPSAVEDAREEEIMAADFVRETLIPEMSNRIDLGPVLFGRWEETLTDSLTLPRSQEVISLLETRRFMSAFVLREREKLRQVIADIRATDPRQ